MIIGVDSRELEGKTTGVGTYLQHILEHFVVPKGVELQLFFKNEIPPSVERIKAAQSILIHSDRSNVAWQQIDLNRELVRRKVNLFFSPNGSCPWFFGGVQVITVHDLSFFRNPEWFRWKERISRKLNTLLSVKEADRIYVDSDHVAGELGSRLGVSASRIRIIPLGIVPKSRDPQKRKDLRHQYGFSGRKLILYAGSIFNRRHLPVLLKAFAQLPQECELVVIGENRTYPFQDLPSIAGGLGIQQRVKFLEYVPSELLDSYYRMADVFVYLSSYEGFGIPPMEAMSYGIPTVLTRTPAMDTVYEEAACFTASISPADVAESLQLCLFDEPQRIQYQEAGIRLADRHRWENTAESIMKDWEHFLWRQ